MKKIQVTLVTLLLTGASLCAQTIGEKELNDIKGSFQKDASTKAIQNVLTNDKNIRDNALNREIQGKIDHYFKYRVKVQGITDQQSSGRCWMFTSMNVLRPSIIEKYNLTGFDFSHNYLYFWDMFEKSNLFLENMIATANKPMDDRDVTFMFQAPVGDGGVWNLYYNLGEKYGVVPKEVMPETAHSNNTSAHGIIDQRASPQRGIHHPGNGRSRQKNQRTACRESICFERYLSHLGSLPRRTANHVHLEIQGQKRGDQGTSKLHATTILQGDHTC